MNQWDARHLLLALACAGLLAACLRERWLRGRLSRAADEARSRLKTLEEQACRRELRVERYDLLWFPILMVSAERKAVLAAVAGLPHCPQCAEPMALKAGHWTCPGCGESRPESVADVMVTDSVAKEAVRQFLQRHRDYRDARQQAG